MRLITSTGELTIAGHPYPDFPILLWDSMESCVPANQFFRYYLRSKGSSASGQVMALNSKRLAEGITQLVKAYALRDADGRSLRMNVSRLRKTFVNRVHEILDGDLVATAVAAGNQPQNTDRHYLRPGEDAESNWRFMGQCLVQELLTGSIGATERTPVGRCTDNKAGEYAPKHSGQICQSFLNCLRCRHYVVTGDDLWRLFSFYWRVLRERASIDRRRWERHLSHIPRLIDRDVIEGGIARKVFTQAQVDAARERARAHRTPSGRAPRSSVILRRWHEGFTRRRSSRRGRNVLSSSERD